MMLLEHLSAFFNFIQLFWESMHSYILEYDSYYMNHMQWPEERIIDIASAIIAQFLIKNVIFVK